MKAKKKLKKNDQRKWANRYGPGCGPILAASRTRKCDISRGGCGQPTANRFLCASCWGRRDVDRHLGGLDDAYGQMF